MLKKLRNICGIKILKNQVFYVIRVSKKITYVTTPTPKQRFGSGSALGPDPEGGKSAPTK
jgi:hypothetical protein